MSKICSCGQEMDWIKTITGGKMPVCLPGEKRIAKIADIYEILGGDQEFPAGGGILITTYKPHWYDCPDRKRYKKKGAKAQDGKKNDS